jgi:hypothetical protein
MIALPGLLALSIPEPSVTAGGEPLTARLRAIRHEFKTTFFKWSALPVLLMMCSPLGSGAALLLLPAMAPHYGVSMDGVTLMNGVVGALLNALGALLVG